MKSLYDQLLGALVGLARASESKEISESAGEAFVDGLAMANSFAHIWASRINSPDTQYIPTSVSTKAKEEPALCQPSSDDILAMIDQLHEEKALMAPDCAACQYPCGRTFDYDMEEVYDASESLREAKLQLFHALSEIAVLEPANTSKTNRQFLSDALFQISCTYTPDQLTAPLNRAADIIKHNG